MVSSVKQDYLASRLQFAKECIELTKDKEGRSRFGDNTPIMYSGKEWTIHHEAGVYV